VVIGIEIVGDLSHCDERHLLALDIMTIQTHISRLIEEHGLSELSSSYHSFLPGVTGIVVLAESHIAFHIWPEYRYTSLNVFVCNFSEDNSTAANVLFEKLVALFQPKRISKSIIVHHAL
jgi:S-adenosylmethionine decarboxylase